MNRVPIASTTLARRSFAWALEPEWEAPLVHVGTPRRQRWWLVEMVDGEPRRAFLPPGEAGAPQVRDPVYRDSFVRWSMTCVPEPAPARFAPVHTYMGQRCVLENRR